MATQFDPALKAYNPGLNGQGKDSLKGGNQHSLSNYNNGQPSVMPVSPHSGVNAVEFQPMGESKRQTAKKSSILGWHRLRITQKATALAIAIGTIPVLLTGITAYQFANQAFSKEVFRSKIQRAVGVEDKVKRFMRERYGDIQVLSTLPVFSTPSLSQTTPLAEKKAALDYFIKVYKIYDSIAVFDLSGNVIVQSQGDSLPNHSDRAYFQAVLKTGEPVISDPELSKSSGKLVIHFAAP
ncbi:MAG TPA: chemotaxis protein CheD, partial [Allocoleopsis sp.]